jgi:16S rRNA (cytosine967-C5)-methyltransferase
MGNAGRITAYDADKRRFGDILDRLARAGVTNVDLRAPVKGGDALAHLHGKADLVLVDAPCTGSGTWRRRPDAKWRLARGALDMRVKQQAEVLEQAARLVRPGGRIVYVTCSVLPEENEERIAAFLSAHRGFAVGPVAPVFEAITGRPAPPMARLPIGGGDALRLTPATTGTDAFFVAFLDRVKTA